MTPGRALLLASTFLLWAVVAQTSFGTPLPPSVFVLAGLGYAAVLLAGALLPGLEMYGDVLGRVEGETTRFALTFDDGPDPVSTRRVLEELRRVEFRATFFVIGRKALAHSEVVAEILRDGHELAVHTMGHSYTFAFWTPSRVRADLEECRDLLRDLGAPDVRFFRPPVLVLSPRIAAGGRAAGLLCVGASVRVFDGRRGSRRALEGRLARVRAGDVVLAHDAVEREEGVPAPVVEVLPSFLETWRSRGLVSVPLSELLLGDEARRER